jgi:hypothetical protein
MCGKNLYCTAGNEEDEGVECSGDGAGQGEGCFIYEACWAGSAGCSHSFYYSIAFYYSEFGGEEADFCRPCDDKLVKPAIVAR